MRRSLPIAGRAIFPPASGSRQGGRFCATGGGSPVPTFVHRHPDFRPDDDYGLSFVEIEHNMNKFLAQGGLQWMDSISVQA
jgi:hypothetical protein